MKFIKVISAFFVSLRQRILSTSVVGETLRNPVSDEGAESSSNELQKPTFDAYPDLRRQYIQDEVDLHKEKVNTQKARTFRVNMTAEREKADAIRAKTHAKAMLLPIEREEARKDREHKKKLRTLSWAAARRSSSKLVTDSYTGIKTVLSDVVRFLSTHTTVLVTVLLGAVIGVGVPYFWSENVFWIGIFAASCLFAVILLAHRIPASVWSKLFTFFESIGQGFLTAIQNVGLLFGNLFRWAKRNLQKRRQAKKIAIRRGEYRSIGTRVIGSFKLHLRKLTVLFSAIALGFALYVIPWKQVWDKVSQLAILLFNSATSFFNALTADIVYVVSATWNLIVNSVMVIYHWFTGGAWVWFAAILLIAIVIFMAPKMYRFSTKHKLGGKAFHGFAVAGSIIWTLLSILLDFIRFVALIVLLVIAGYGSYVGQPYLIIAPLGFLPLLIKWKSTPGWAMGVISTVAVELFAASVLLLQFRLAGG